MNWKLKIATYLTEIFRKKRFLCNKDSTTRRDINGDFIFRKVLILTIAFNLIIACKPSNNYELTKKVNFEHLGLIVYSNINGTYFKRPSLVIHINHEDSIIIEKYLYLTCGTKYKAAPHLYMGRIFPDQYQKLNFLINKYDFLNKGDSLKIANDYTYGFSLKTRDTSYRFDCISNTKIRGTLKELFEYIMEIADTTKFSQIDYFNYHNGRKNPLPPLPFKSYIEME